MKRIAMFSMVFQFVVGSQAQAQEIVDSHYHLDGFEVQCSYGYSFLKNDDETEIVIQTPGENWIRGLVIQDNQVYMRSLKEVLVIAARELVADWNDDTFSERISITFTVTKQGIKGYWVDAEIGELHYAAFAADLRDSPGFAVLLYFIVDKITLPVSQQEDILGNLLENARINFYEAAG